MAIPDEDVEAVRARTDLAILIGEKVGLRPQGSRLVGLCPFHDENSPSFSVNPGAGFYYCFGCGASGDAISFVRAVEHVDFVEAVQRLAGRVGLEIRTGGDESKGRTRRRRLEAVMLSAVDWYHQRLLSHPDAGRARNYLRSRGFDGDVVRSFKLGWAPDGWDTLCKVLSLPEDLAKETGLGFRNRAGRLQDSFRNRVMFPIFDAGDRPVAFGGRILPQERDANSGEVGAAQPGPKYVNSSETALYSKRRTLYALNWAKPDIVSTGEVIVCEGYTDVIGCFQAGLPRAVATCGTSLAEEHFGLLRNFAQRIVLAFDADSAGQAAAARFYEWESRHQLDIAVAALPPGEDPGELARVNPSKLIAAVQSARPYLEFRLERCFAEEALANPAGRAKAARAALEVISEHPDELVRDQYLMSIADRCRMESSTLRSQLTQLLAISASPGQTGSGRTGSGRTGPGRTGSGRTGSGRTGSGSQVGTGSQVGPRRSHGSVQAGAGQSPRGEASGSNSGARLGHVGAVATPAAERIPPPALEALRLAVRDPAAVVARLEGCCFPAGVAEEAFEALLQASTLGEAISMSSSQVANLLTRLAVEDVEPDPDSVGRLIDHAAQRSLMRLQALVRQDPSKSVDLSPVIGWLKAEIERLRESPGESGAEAALVAWLSEQQEEPE